MQPFLSQVQLVPMYVGSQSVRAWHCGSVSVEQGAAAHSLTGMQ
jgi:hypothetical protein